MRCDADKGAQYTVRHELLQELQHPGAMARGRLYYEFMILIPSYQTSYCFVSFRLQCRRRQHMPAAVLSPFIPHRLIFSFRPWMQVPPRRPRLLAYPVLLRRHCIEYAAARRNLSAELSYPSSRATVAFLSMQKHSPILADKARSSEAGKALHYARLPRS